MIRRATELVLAVAGIVIAVLLWRSGIHPGDYAPLDAGLPAFTSNYYDGSRIGGAVAIIAVSVVVAADAVRPHRPRAVDELADEARADAV